MITCIIGTKRQSILCSLFIFIIQETIQNEKLDVLEIESMDMSTSNHASPAAIDTTRKLFRPSTVLRYFVEYFYILFSETTHFFLLLFLLLFLFLI